MAKSTKQEKKAMFNAYAEFWKKHTAELNNSPMLKATVEQFITATDSINTINLDDTVGITASKEDLNSKLQNTAFEVNCALLAYANFTNNTELQRTFKHVKTDFTSINDLALIDFVKPIKNKALELASELIEFISSNDINSIESLSSSIIEKLNTRTDLQNTNAVSRNEVERLFVEQMARRATLKLMVVNFKRGDMNFHHEHELARKIHYAKTTTAGNGDSPINPVI